MRTTVLTAHGTPVKDIRASDQDRLTNSDLE